MEEREISHSRATRLGAAETCTLSDAIYEFNAMVPITVFKGLLRELEETIPNCVWTHHNHRTNYTPNRSKKAQRIEQETFLLTLDYGTKFSSSNGMVLA